VPTDPSFDSIRTDRLIVRRFSPRDVAEFCTYRTDPEIARYQGWGPPYRPEEGMSFVASLVSIDPGTPGAWFQFAIEERETGELVGDCGLRVDAEAVDRAELGFTIARSHQGRGLAREAVDTVLRYAADRLDVRRVVAVTDARNRASIALLERLGMRRVESRTVRFKGERCEEYEYRLERPASGTRAR
jgi:RimJ/RimL family protein N-acetyltransferase